MRCPETSTTNDQPSLRNIPEQRRPPCVFPDCPCNYRLLQEDMFSPLQAVSFSVNIYVLHLLLLQAGSVVFKFLICVESL